jgi:CspA family cold shock protein
VAPHTNSSLRAAAPGPLRSALDLSSSKKEERKKHMETGTVKFFNNDRGFGFITPSNGERDVFVHFSNVVGEGQRSLQDGQQVEFDVAQGPKGPEAQNVRPV